MYRQEYLCEFVDPVGQMFKTSEIDEAFDDDVEPLFGAGEAAAGGPADPVDSDIETLDV
jgi:hypothetical protein